MIYNQGRYLDSLDCVIINTIIISAVIKVAIILSDHKCHSEVNYWCISTQLAANHPGILFSFV